MSPVDLTPHRVAVALRGAGRPVGDATVLAVHDTLRRDVVGAGPLEPLLALPGVTDVLVNGPDAVYLDRGDGLEPTGVSFVDDEAVRRLAQRLAAGAGRRLDDATPYVDVRLADGTRCHAVLAPIARPGTTVSLRVPSRRRLDLEALVAARALTDEGARLLSSVVGRRLAFLVTGGTGVGKTTLLASLLSRVDPGRPSGAGRGLLRAATRPSPRRRRSRPGRPTSRAPARSRSATLVRQALRMRPDRLVVGEVRDGSVTDLLAALNTGHEGGCGTLHANSADRRPRPDRGTRAGGRVESRGHAQPDRLRPRRGGPPRARGGRSTGRCARSRCPRGRPTGWCRLHPAVTFDDDGGSRLGPGAAGLERRLRGRRAP